MTTICRAYTTEDEAGMAVERLLASGMGADEIRVLMGEQVRDHRDVPTGRFAGSTENGQVGTFAGAATSDHGSMGTYAGDADQQRRGGFGDIDRETVTEYRNGVRRVRIASHRNLTAMLVDPGRDEPTAAHDVEALHRGSVLVLVRTSAAATSDTL